MPYRCIICYDWWNIMILSLERTCISEFLIGSFMPTIFGIFVSIYRRIGGTGSKSLPCWRWKMLVESGKFLVACAKLWGGRSRWIQSGSAGVRQLGFFANSCQSSMGRQKWFTTFIFGATNLKTIRSSNLKFCQKIIRISSHQKSLGHWKWNRTHNVESSGSINAGASLAIGLASGSASLCQSWGKALL